MAEKKEGLAYVRFIRRLIFNVFTTNDGFECYSRGGFAKFDHGSLERGMREAILRGKVSRQMSTLREVRVSPFILTFIFHRSDTFDPRWEIHLPSNFPPSFSPLIFFHVCVKIEERSARKKRERESIGVFL